MAYRRSTYQQVSPWQQQREDSFPMGSYGQSYSSYGSSRYAWNGGHSANQLEMIDFDRPMTYDVPLAYGMSLRYENERLRRNQMTLYRESMYGKRLRQRSPPPRGPPSKRPNLGVTPKRRPDQISRARENLNNNKQKTTNASAARKPMQGRQLSRRPTASGAAAKRTNLVNKTVQRNDRRRRFFRVRRNFRRSLREDTESDFEEYEILKKPEDEQKNGDLQNEETMEVDTASMEEGKKAEGKKGSPEKKEVKKFAACHVCKVATTYPELLTEHMNTEEHKTKIEGALTEYREKKKSAEEEKDKDKDQKKTKTDNWCEVCEIAFSGPIRLHRGTSKHRRTKDKKFPRCRSCSTGFGSPEEYKEHIKSVSHKQKSAEFYHLRRLPIGSDNNEAALAPAKTEEEETKVDENKTEDKKTKKTDPIGVSFIMEVHGYFCKLCCKFFKSENVAKKTHCCSEMHNSAYKQAMDVALKAEEERQKIVDVRAEITGDSDLAAVQREARAAARKSMLDKRAAKKKAEEEAKKEEKDGVVTPAADGQEKPAEAQEAQGEANAPAKEEKAEEMCT